MPTDTNQRAKPDGWKRDWQPGRPTPPDQYHARFLKRFWAKVNKNGPVMRADLGRCWVWTGSQALGYGQIGHRSKGPNYPIRAHVAAWTLVYGHPEPPKGWHVCHECNNKACVRESHLWPGTPADNYHHGQVTGLNPKVDWEKREAERFASLNAQAKLEREFIDRHLHFVKPKAREILKLRYGHTFAECKTLQEVGDIYGVTRERIRQIQIKAEETILVFTTEKNIPIPLPKGRDLANEVRETLNAMQPGDSFVVPRADIQNIRRAAITGRFMITVRSVGKDKSRVWLVSKPQSSSIAA